MKAITSPAPLNLAEQLERFVLTVGGGGGGAPWVGGIERNACNRNTSCWSDIMTGCGAETGGACPCCGNCALPGISRPYSGGGDGAEAPADNESPASGGVDERTSTSGAHPSAVDGIEPSNCSPAAEYVSAFCC